MKHIIIVISFLFVSNLFFAQSKNTEYKVQKGETVTQIAKKLDLTIAEIFKLNPDAQKGVKENTILIVPNKKAVNKTATTPPIAKKHEVKTKETLFSIAQQYNLTEETIISANPDIINEQLKIGQVLIIPNKNIVVKNSPVKKELPTVTENIIHQVKQGDTKFSIAKQYNTTVEQLEKLNPEVTQNLPLDYKLIVGTQKGKSKKAVAETPKPETTLPNKTKPQTTPKQETPVHTTPNPVVLQEPVVYTILAKETLYSLSNKFDITQEALIALNPELNNGVKEGMSIKVPAKSIAAVTVKKEYVDIAKTFKAGNLKKIALLLPFNISKLDQDTINSTQSRLKKDKFLNLTLDFYAGALMAIDSVKKMGMNVEVKILDSNETKTTSNVSYLIQDNNLKSMDAVIGPFYQNNVEKAAEMLAEANIPVISPLSKEYNKSYPNLFQATPSVETIKIAMFDYMRYKDGKVIAVIDPKKNAIKQYITDNQKDVTIAPITETGTITTDYLKTVLVKDKTNYIIMETERTNLILNITSTLQTLSATYPIKLVILQENEALDYEEISMSRLTKLNMHYPSITRPNETPEAIIFENNFKKKNKILPNQFATRGFDITFDVLMRLSQDKSFVDTLEDASQQVENKFYYIPNPAGGYNNKGVHILYYDTDLTIKEAK